MGSIPTGGSWFNKEGCAGSRFQEASAGAGREGVAGPFASAPPEATLPDSSPVASKRPTGPRRKPSEIPSKTRSVSAFHPGRVSVVFPLLRRSTLRDPATPCRVKSCDTKFHPTGKSVNVPEASQGGGGATLRMSPMLCGAAVRARPDYFSSLKPRVEGMGTEGSPWRERDFG